MAIDPELLAAIEARAANGPSSTDLPSMRAAFAAAGAALPAPEVGAVSDHLAPGGDGGVRVRIYRPEGRERPPLLIFLHGGGFMLGDVETHDAACRHLVAAAGCAVAAVGYRLAPEDPFPAGLNDCQSATEWLLDQAGALGLDPNRVVIGGESAGGNLAAVVARRLATRTGNRPMLQLLVHPLTDFRLQTPSITAIEAPGLTVEGMNMVRAVYLGAADPMDPDASPGLAADLAGLPPAIVVTVEIDPLRDEGEAYALRLATAGVETTLVRLPGLVHGFMFESARIRVVAEGIARIGAMVRRHLDVMPRQPVS